MAEIVGGYRRIRAIAPTLIQIKSVRMFMCLWFPPFERREGWGTLSCGNSGES
jgi:hypothetical protein